MPCRLIATAYLIASTQLRISQLDSEAAARRARMKTGPLGGYSLRAGCVTQAAIREPDARDMIVPGRQKSRSPNVRTARVIHWRLLASCDQ